MDVRPYMHTLRTLPAALVLLMLAAGCSPSLAPLYQDYAIEQVPADSADVGPDLRAEQISRALRDAGWDLAETSLHPAVATEPRTHREWGLYRVTVSLEAVPMGNRYVRVLVHPYREYVWGRRSKMPYLTRAVRRAVLPDLNRSFREHGLIAQIPD